jgi:hypothetical protein
MEIYFPPITPEQLWPFKVVRQLLAENQALLDDPACPYSDEIKAFFGAAQGSPAPVPSETKSWDDLELEIQSLATSLDEFGKTLEKSDVTERMSFFRTKTSLLEKIVGLKERSLGIREVHQFQEAVLNLIEEVLEPGQRTEFMKRLAEWLKS